MQILVLSLKGGVGETTTSVHLAGTLAEHGSTLLVDADPAQGALEWAARGNLPFDVQTPDDAKPKKYDFVIIDTRAQPKAKTLDAFSRKADLLIVPSSTGILSLETLPKLRDDLEDMAFRVLLTLAPPPSRDGERAVQRLQELSIPHFATIIRRYATLEKAAVQGILVRDVHDARASAAWQDVRQLTQEVLQHHLSR